MNYRTNFRPSMLTVLKTDRSQTSKAQWPTFDENDIQLEHKGEEREELKRKKTLPEYNRTNSNFFSERNNDSQYFNAVRGLSSLVQQRLKDKFEASQHYTNYIPENSRDYFNMRKMEEQIYQEKYGLHIKDMANKKWVRNPKPTSVKKLLGFLNLSKPEKKEVKEEEVKWEGVMLSLQAMMRKAMDSKDARLIPVILKLIGLLPSAVAQDQQLRKLRESYEDLEEYRNGRPSTTLNRKAVGYHILSNFDLRFLHSYYKHKTFGSPH